MFQPQPTPFSTFYPSYFAGPLDSFPQQPLPPPPQQQPEEDGLQVNDDSYGPPQAQAQAQAQVLADGQETIRTGGFSYQQPSFAHPHAGAGGLEYQSGAVIAPCPGAGPGSTGGGPSVNPGEPGLGGPGPGPGPGPGAAAGVAHARAIAAGAGGDLSPPVQLQQQAAGPEVQVAMRFPSLHGAIPHPQHPLPAATRNLFDHTPSSALHRTRTQRQHQFRSIPHRHRHRQRPIPGSKMEPDQSLQDDLAAQEAAARTWQPELEGPRVGDKTLIDAITAEYAKADPVYVAKTMALPQTYTHYRPIKGDGSCGWRAIVFCYFELLIQQGSQELVQGEELRIRQLNDYLFNSGGYDPDMFMDFVDETTQLCKDIAENIHAPEVATAILETKFNDDSSMGLLYHFRILAASWLKGNRDQYEAWCENGVDQYVQTVIDPIDREIEELGVVLLVEVLLKPVGFTLEIAYLDRSAGTEVNTHRFPESSPNIGGPFMHLLYRPGHYDILYKPNTSQAIQVNRMSYEPTSFAPTTSFAATFDYNPMLMVPGLGGLGPFANPMGQLGGSSLDFSPSPQSPWFPPPCVDSSPATPTQSITNPPAYATPQQDPLPVLQTQSAAPGPSNRNEIRFSRYQYEEAMDVNQWPEQSFQTSMFKNSHFNKAHYNNPDFTPEAYNPGADDASERPERPRKKGHGKGGRQSSEDSTDSKRDK